MAAPRAERTGVLRRRDEGPDRQETRQGSSRGARAPRTGLRRDLQPVACEEGTLPAPPPMSPPAPQAQPAAAPCQAGVEQVTEDRAVSSSSRLPRPISTDSGVSFWKPRCQKPLLSSSGLSFTSIYSGSPSDRAAPSRLAASPCHSLSLKEILPRSPSLCHEILL